MFDECLEYLDLLRSAGTMNMYGATPYLAAEFDLSTKDARLILAHWMDTFDERT